MLQIEGLQVTFRARGSLVRALRGVDLTIAAGEVIGLVGESGSGKSTIAQTIAGLLPPNARVDGSLRFQGDELLTATRAKLDQVRGRQIGFIFQDPMASLNPVRTIGDQLLETLRHLSTQSGRVSAAEAVRRLDEVGVRHAAEVLGQLPHQLSGGIAQRVMIALALAGDPQLIVADEPTTALDVTTQRTILDLLERLRRERGLSILFVSHDLAVVNALCNRICVLYAGAMMEEGPTARLIAHPAHPYTAGLLGAVPAGDGRGGLPKPMPGSVPDGSCGGEGCLFRPRCPVAAPVCAQTPLKRPIGPGHDCACHSPVSMPRQPRAEAVAAIARQAGSRFLQVDGLSLRYPGARRLFFRSADGRLAVNDVSFSIDDGECLGLVGESGCGKSSIAKLLTRQTKPCGGRILVRGLDWTDRSRQGRLAWSRVVQLVFQNPRSALDPRCRIGASIAEPLRFHGDGDRASRKRRALDVMEEVGLSPSLFDRRPGELSGGQLQRVVIARALVLEPALLVCDEPVSALDVSVQARILEILDRLRREHHLAMLFISHDLSVVAQMCDRIAVMKAGKILEIAPAWRLLSAPRHAYTAQLLADTPKLDAAPVDQQRRLVPA